MATAGYIGRKGGIVYKTKDGNPTNGWWLRFKERYQEVNGLDVGGKSEDGGTYVSEKIEEVPKEDVDKRILEDVNTFVKEAVNHKDEDTHYNMVSVPSRISERGDLLDFTPPSCIKHSDSQLMTLTVCTCANGMVLPSLITMANKTAEVEGSMCVETQLGDIDPKTFLQYLKHLDTFISKKRPAFVFVSGLENLLEAGVVEFCVEKGIHLLCLSLPNVIQPSDIIPRILQAELNTKSRTDTDTPKINVFQLLERFLSSSKKAQGEPLKAAFRQTGIFPLDITVLRPGSIPKHRPHDQTMKECCVAEKKALTLQKR